MTGPVVEDVVDGVPGRCEFAGIGPAHAYRLRCRDLAGLAVSVTYLTAHAPIVSVGGRGAIEKYDQVGGLEGGYACPAKAARMAARNMSRAIRDIVTSLRQIRRPP